MFRIGEFAQIAQVSSRQLRFYDQLGLLQPARTDSQTGYRYYSVKQLPRLNSILAKSATAFGDGTIDMSTSKFRRLASCGCALIGLAFSATGCLSYDADGFVSFGVGNKFCDQYVADAAQPDCGFVYETWLSGYLTAFNAYNHGSSDILTGPDFNGAVAWLKNYCREHPTVIVHVATVKFIQLMQQKRR
jgi:MerR HTH family regulatory protein